MKTRLWRAALVGGLVALGATAAHAGWKSTGRVIVSTPGKYAQGNLGDARAADNTLEYIGCQVISWVGASSAYCFAEDSTGQSAFCMTSDPGQIETARSVSSFSYLIFYWNDSYQCTLVQTNQMSFYTPMIP